MGGVLPTFRHAKKNFVYLGYEVETLQVVRFSLSCLALKNFQDNVVYSML